MRGAQPAIQQQIGLDALKRLYEAKGFNPHLLRDVRRRVASKLACCLFAFALVASLSVHLLVCARMCVVGSDSVVSRYSLALDMAVYVVSSLLRPDGTVQTTSQVTLDVQTRSSSRSTRAMQDQTAEVRSRSPVPRRSRVRLTPGPHGHSEDEDDWGEWTQSA